jgi:hypothetical protein
MSWSDSGARFVAIVLNTMRFAAQAAASLLLLAIPRLCQRNASSTTRACETVARNLISIKDVVRPHGLYVPTDSPSCLREEKMPWLKQQPSFP